MLRIIFVFTKHHLEFIKVDFCAFGVKKSITQSHTLLLFVLFAFEILGIDYKIPILKVKYYAFTRD